MLTVPVWIAVDWGTSHLRAWAMGEDPAPLEERRSDQGMGRLAPTDFAPALTTLLDGWVTADRPIPVMICGMAGSRQGWCEAPYQAVPGPVSRLSGSLATPPDSIPGAVLRIVPGLRQNDPPDVMRGEETQLSGLLALEPEFDGVVCLPGTHSKWAVLAGGEVKRFQTCMTGELFRLLTEDSILRHSVSGASSDSIDDAFWHGVREGLEQPLSTSLFAVRGRSLLLDADKQEAQERLSGLLIGAELAAVLPDLPMTGTPWKLIGDHALVQRYQSALEAAGRPTMALDGTRVVIAGLDAIRRRAEF